MVGLRALLGMTLGACRLERLLGQGAMGAVFLAQQACPQRQVAVKVLLPSLLLDSPQHTLFLARFRREAEAVAALDHANILPIFEYGEQEGLAYLVMPYIPGGTLTERLARIAQGAPLSLTQVAHWLDQAAAALGYAHQRGIVHRHVKPSNVLLHPDGCLLLADFGLAWLANPDPNENHFGPEFISASRALPSSGMTFSTPEYTAPEQLFSGHGDERADIYSLGALTYEMLSGVAPFLASSPFLLATMHLNDSPPPLRQRRPDLSPEGEQVVLKALAKEPTQRFQTAPEFASAFRATLATTRLDPLPAPAANAEAVAEQPTEALAPLDQLAASGPNLHQLASNHVEGDESLSDQPTQGLCNRSAALADQPTTNLSTLAVRQPLPTGNGETPPSRLPDSGIGASRRAATSRAAAQANAWLAALAAEPALPPSNESKGLNWATVLLAGSVLSVLAWLTRAVGSLDLWVWWALMALAVLLTALKQRQGRHGAAVAEAVVVASLALGSGMFSVTFPFAGPRPADPLLSRLALLGSGVLLAACSAWLARLLLFSRRALSSTLRLALGSLVFGGLLLLTLFGLALNTALFTMRGQNVSFDLHYRQSLLYIIAHLFIAPANALHLTLSARPFVEFVGWALAVVVMAVALGGVVVIGRMQAGLATGSISRALLGSGLAHLSYLLVAFLLLAWLEGEPEVLGGAIEPPNASLTHGALPVVILVPLMALFFSTLGALWFQRPAE